MGHRIERRLAEIGITTPLQLRDADPAMIRQRFNVVLQRTVLELQGTPCLDPEQDSPDSPERVRLAAAVDGLNSRYGRDRVRYASSGIERPWKLKAEFHSPRYTTRWAELLAIP